MKVAKKTNFRFGCSVENDETKLKHFFHMYLIKKQTSPNTNFIPHSTVSMIPQHWLAGYKRTTSKLVQLVAT